MSKTSLHTEEVTTVEEYEDTHTHRYCHLIISDSVVHCGKHIEWVQRNFVVCLFVCLLVCFADIHCLLSVIILLVYVSVMLSPYSEWMGGGANMPPLTSFSPVTSTNVGLSPQKFLTFSFNPISILV